MCYGTFHTCPPPVSSQEVAATSSEADAAKLALQQVQQANSQVEALRAQLLNLGVKPCV